MQINVPSSSLEEPATYHAQFENFYLKINDTQQFELVDNNSYFRKITLDTSPSKELGSSNRNSMFLTLNEQQTSGESHGDVMASSPITDASLLTSTLFNGNLNLKIRGFVDNWNSQSTAVKADLYFKLFIKEGTKFIEEYSSLIWSSEFSDTTMFNLNPEDISIDLGKVFTNYSANGDPELTQYQIRFLASYSANKEGLTPRCGIEIIESSLILTDLPPQGDFYNVKDGSILSGCICCFKKCCQ
ncbi:MAG: hypothetical protein ACTSVK_01455 [Promethearchaeota archaeon]